MWNKITKRIENWRLNYPQKMYRYIKERFPHVLNKPISGNIWKIINDENVALPTLKTEDSSKTVENSELIQKSDENTTLDQTNDEDCTLDKAKNNKRKETNSKNTETAKNKKTKS